MSGHSNSNTSQFVCFIIWVPDAVRQSTSSLSFKSLCEFEWRKILLNETKHNDHCHTDKFPEQWDN